MYEVKVEKRQGEERVNIILTKGDTFIAEVEPRRKITQEIYTPVEGDVIRFAMKRSYSDTESLIRKVIPHDTMTLRIESEDTKSLPVRPYYYDIEITFEDGTVDTFIKGTFTLDNEVE